MYSFDNELVLQTSTTITSSTKVAGTGKSINLLSVGPNFRAVFDVYAVTVAGGQTYVLGVDAAASTNFASAVTASLPSVNAVGRYELPLSSQFFQNHRKGDSVGAIRSFVDASDAGSIEYSAFLAP